MFFIKIIFCLDYFSWVFKERDWNYNFFSFGYIGWRTVICENISIFKFEGCEWYKCYKYSFG